MRSASTNADGVFFAPLKPDRSVRVRVTGGGVRSDVLTIAVLPRYSFAFRAAGRRIKIRFTIRGPRSLRLAGRRAYVYLGRMKSRRYQRLGSARLRQVRRGRSAGAIVVRPPRGVGGKDVVTLCVPGQVRLGMGAPDVLNRRCGARSVRWRRR